MNSQLLLLLVCIYGGLLFAIAWLAERYSHYLNQSWWRPLVYCLSIGVYCSSWTFLGAVGTAVENGWHYFSIYLGPILLVLFGWRFIRRLLLISSRNKVTSIADFIGSRYGKNQRLAATVTLVLVVGTLPYIALQLKGVGIAWDAIEWGDGGSLRFDLFSSLMVAGTMALFSILFGTQVIDGPNRFRGMITAIATESAVKLVAFLVVGVLAIYSLFQQDAGLAVSLANFQAVQFFSPTFLTQMFLAAAAIICLPRQFHVMVVEFQHRRDLRYLRWFFPVYLLIFAALVFPIAQLGARLFSGLAVEPDSYIMVIPQWLGAESVVALVFIGATSAATGMVVVATIALSIMISNELVVPLWLKFSSKTRNSAADLGKSLRLIRRISILVILLLGWALQQVMDQVERLASLGLISFAAAAQLLPAVLAALYWRQGHARGVMAGLAAGMTLWAYCLLLPAILGESHPLVMDGLLGISWLSPWNLFGTGGLDHLSHGVLWSVLCNSLLFIYVSRRSRHSKLDLRQAAAFTGSQWFGDRSQLDMEPSGIEVVQLQSLMEPLLGAERTQHIWQEFEARVEHRLLPHDQAPRFTVAEIEKSLASIIGAVSAHKAIELLVQRTPLQLHDFVSLVGGSSRQIQFSQNLLQTTLETVPQGIIVIDRDMKLVAWNQQYQDLFEYPQRLLYVGCDIAKIYRYNADRGYFLTQEQDSSVDATIARRLERMQSGERHRLERTLPNGRVLEISGVPLPNGGYVTTYTDVTDYHEMLNQLQKARAQLEDRVESRTQELREANQSLQRENFLRSRIEQELSDAHASKSRFLAAASHDLLQPVNAARLFVSSLSEKVARSDDAMLQGDIQHLDAALSSAERLISSLREISRLSSGKEVPQRQNFTLSSLLQPMAQEASVLAAKRGLSFRYVDSSGWIYSDPQLMRRLIQNLVSNALHYTKEGKVLLGCRRHSGLMLIEVWDTGIGIDESNRERIFDEFERLSSVGGTSQGLGLGLSITRNIAQLLGHHLSFSSEPGRGSVFRVAVPMGEPQPEAQPEVIADPQLEGLRVLCIDNELEILAGMQSLLQQWGCQVVTALNLKQVLSQWQQPEKPDLILADYHLDTETGLDVLEALRYHWQEPLSAIVISADNSALVVEAVHEAGFKFLAKPVLPQVLRTLMRKAIRQKTNP